MISFTPPFFSIPRKPLLSCIKRTTNISECYTVVGKYRYTIQAGHQHRKDSE